MALAGLMACASEPPPVSDVMDNALPSIVEILGESGTGTGFIIDEAGLVVTNRHIVEGDDRVLIRVATGEVYIGRITRTHSDLDLAYIEIDADREFTPIILGDSEEIRVGDGVLAIGFPLGLELGRAPTITKGIISAKREAPAYLQTDAPLNPGNSGGPLLDEFGKVIGVNTSGIGERDGRTITGINFAIPINEVKKDLEGRTASGQLAAAATATPTMPMQMPTVRPTAAAPTPLALSHVWNQRDRGGAVWFGRHGC